jgi:chromosome segregation ATPase
MVKKVILGSGILLVAGVLVFGRDALSYLRTSATHVKDTFQSSVPIEFEIDRARNMIKDLVPEVRKNMQVIAKEEVEVQRLDEQITGAEAKLVKEKDQIMRLKTDLTSGKNVFRYASRNYSADDVKTDLANRFERYKTSDATLASLKEIRSARQKSLEAARQKLEGMLAAKRQLQVEVENLEARTQIVAAAQTTSQYQFDDSQLGRVKELVSNLRTRLNVAEKLVNAEVEFQGEIPLEKTVSENVVDQVGEYFGEKPAPMDAEKSSEEKVVASN